MIERGLPADRIDTSRPHPARMYNYYLGGKDNYEVDRMAADRVIEALPEIIPTARELRAFVVRASTFLAGRGVRQVIDVGTGIPTQPYLHELMRADAPDAEVVYIDNDPIVSVHVGPLLTGSGATFTLGDLREPERILGHPRVAGFLGSGQPVALLLAGVLHFLRDKDDPAGAVAVLRDALPAGSYLVISHATRDFAQPRHNVTAVVDVYRDAAESLNLRTGAEIMSYFGDFELLPPGLVQAQRWHPGPEGLNPDAEYVGIYGGVARRNN